MPTLVRSRKTEQKPWWNRPLIGQLSMTERIVLLIQSLKRKNIPEEAIFLHREAFKETQKLAKRAQSIDSEKFGNPDFLAYVRLKDNLSDDSLYGGLDRYASLLKAGFEAKESFVALETIEFNFVSKKQREFYQYVDSLYPRNLKASQFIERLNHKQVEVLAELRSEEGKKAIQTYCQYLEAVVKHQLGFKLLASFKKRKMSNFSILAKASDIVASINRDDVFSKEKLNVVVIANYDLFVKLGHVIGLPTDWENVKTYGILLQYIAFTDKYKRAYQRFQQLILVLTSWHTYYETLSRIRKEQSPQNRFKSFKEFKVAVPGLPLYQHYSLYLNK